MKHLNLIFIVLGLFHFGCNPKYKLTTGKNSTDTTNSQTPKQNNSPDYEQLNEYKINSVKNIIALFKEKNIDKISSKINFPLYREFPIPPIKNKEEFKQRFSEVFDKILIDEIANSKIDQWTDMGWEGIMLDRGALWMTNSDGIIKVVNYQSDREKKLRKDLIAKEKENLHISLKSFENPAYKIKTKNYLIRIDELTNHKYRYASWKISEQESSKPDIILDNGEFEYIGSGGNHVFTFFNHNYTYRIYRNIVGAEGSSDFTLEIEKDEQIILTQNGTLDY